MRNVTEEGRFIDDIEGTASMEVGPRSRLGLGQELPGNGSMLWSVRSVRRLGSWVLVVAATHRVLVSENISYKYLEFENWHKNSCTYLSLTR